MSEAAKKIIEAVINKKPLEIKEHVNTVLREKATKIVNDSEIYFEEDTEIEDELTEEETLELEKFFEEFKAEYGHLSEEEQEKILVGIEEDLQKEIEEEFNEDEDVE